MKKLLLNFYKGLNKEFRRIRWIKLNYLWPLTFVVIGFILAFGIYFVGVDVIIKFLIDILKINN